MLNIVIPMAGEGKKFLEKGYTFPKPLVEINGKPMIEWVIRNLSPKEDHRFVFICRREIYEKFKLGSMLQLLSPGCKVVVLSAPTQGAAATVLMAKEHIDTLDPLLIAGSDQFVEGGTEEFLSQAKNGDADGYIMTFESTHPKWSFAKVGSDGLVMETAEKNPISNHASVGLYYFKTGKSFVEAAESMIKKDIRTNNEFFLCPVYNELILNDKKIKIHEIPSSHMHSWATPEDLESFIKDQEKLKVLK
jgi:dTDP-glucose pyrophosphorylase